VDETNGKTTQRETETSGRGVKLLKIRLNSLDRRLRERSRVLVAERGRRDKAGRWSRPRGVGYILTWNLSRKEAWKG
jgi:hypothetical protein